MASTYEVLGIFLVSFSLNIVPFAGPSNLFIAFNASLAVDAAPLTIGFLVALGSASAKLIHYLVTFFLRGFIGEKRRRRLEAAGLKLKHWASLALFLVAASPLPDDPVVIPLGLLKYSPVKLFLAYFAGKLMITSAGAYLGRLGEETLAPFVSSEIITIASIVLTVALTIILLKVDLDKLTRRILRRKDSLP